MTDIAFRSATELAAAVRRREISSRELLDVYLARIDELNPRLDAVVLTDPEGARRGAAAADEATARGESWGPLHGLPMTIKDAFEVEGMVTTSGEPMHADHVPAADADAVARLRDAGAVIIGHTNVPASCGDWQSFNEVYGTTNNPWDVTRTPGGSSGGSAAALAAGLTSFEIGSDVAGSIRIPCHFSGVYGLKTTFGIIPFRGHIPGEPGSLGHLDLVAAGPMGRSADDLDLGLDVLAAPSPVEARAWRLDLPPARHDTLSDYRIAAWLDDPYCVVDSELVDLMSAAVDALAGAGAAVTRRAGPVSLPESHQVYSSLLCAQGSTFFSQEQYDFFLEVAASAPLDDDSNLTTMSRGFVQRFRDWSATDARRQEIRASWAEFFTEHDVLLCPVAPTAAVPHDHLPDLGARTIEVNGQTRPYTDHSIWVGAIGMPLLPSAVVPIGRTAGGLPVGIQIVAPYLEDRTAVDVARRLSDLLGGFEAPEGY